MTVVGLDPGTDSSAIVVFNGLTVESHAILSNALVVSRLSGDDMVFSDRAVLATEYMESSLGMAVGKETCQTIFWNGRFVQAWCPRPFALVTRYNVKKHLCGQVRATDANIRQALIDRFGGSTERAIGKVKAQGPLFGIKSHEWAALAVAVTYYDQAGHLPPEIRPGVRPEF